MNFAYEIVIDGKGWNKPIVSKKPLRPVKKDHYIKNIYNPIFELHYWFDDSNVITLEEALSSNEPFVYPLRCPQNREIPWNDKFKNFPEKLIECINKGQCKFVIDDSREGRFWDDELVKFFVISLQDNVIDPKNVIVLTQTHTYLYDKFPFKMIQWNWNESFIRSQIIDDFKPKKEDAKKFLCFSRHPKDFRTDFIRQMWNRGILDQFNVGLGKVEGDDEFARSTPFQYDIETVWVDGFQKEEWKLTALYPQHQEENYLYVVLGSVFDHSEENDIDEKTWKPIAMKMPFILVNLPHTLRRLRDLGYQTFPWDESYDDIEDPDERMAAIVDLVSHLNSRTDFKDMIKSCEDIVEHNFDLIKLRRPEHTMIKALS